MNGEIKTDVPSCAPEWLKPEFYSTAYDRFIKLRWNIDPFPGENRFLDPRNFELSQGDINRIGILFFGFQLIDLSSHRITGEINGMYDNILNLKAWQQILPEYDKKKELHLIDQFVEPLLVSCLTAPFAIKNQIIFAGTKIAILLERGQCQPKIPTDRQIKKVNDLQNWAAKWPHFSELKKALNNVHDDAYIISTKDFRHRYTHRTPPRIGLGITPNFILEREGNGLRIRPKIDQPLELATATEACICEHRKCVAAFQAFWKMLNAKLSTM